MATVRRRHGTLGIGPESSSGRMKRNALTRIPNYEAPGQLLEELGQDNGLTQDRLDQKKVMESFSQYDRCAGVEGTLSQGMRVSDLRRARYIGLAKTRLQP